MDPISIGVAAVGLGMSIFGTMGASQKAGQIAQAQAEVTGLEGQVNDQRKVQMEMEARRQRLENFRQVQRAQATARNNATSQNAQFGSGLQGGLAQASDQGYFNDAGVAGNLEIGRNIFGLDSQISQKKMQISSLGGELATDQGYASLGGTLMKSADTFGKVFGAARAGLSNGITVPGYNPFAGMLAQS